jgi:hypothetical protein
MSSTLEKILAEVETLSSAERTELRQALAMEPDRHQAPDAARRQARVYEVWGSLAHLPGSSEEFMAERRAETERENARHPE